MLYRKQNLEINNILRFSQCELFDLTSAFILPSSLYALYAFFIPKIQIWWQWCWNYNNKKVLYFSWNLIVGQFESRLLWRSQFYFFPIGGVSVLTCRHVKGITCNLITIPVWSVFYLVILLEDSQRLTLKSQCQLHISYIQ